MTEPMFNNRSSFCASLGAFGRFSPASAVHVGCCTWNLMKGVVGGGHCTLFSDSCAPRYLSPTFWWLLRSRSGLPKQCLFIRELLCQEKRRLAWNVSSGGHSPQTFCWMVFPRPYLLRTCNHLQPVQSTTSQQWDCCNCLKTCLY